jgi:hypothetical protein
MMTDQQAVPQPSAWGQYFVLTAVAAGTAAVAAYTSVSAGLPIWAMFMGWVAYFTRKPSAREGLMSFICFAIGLTFGAVAATVMGFLVPKLGTIAIPLVVFSTAMVVITMRGLPILNNLLGYFLGLIGFFASHLAPELASIAQLGAASALGAVAGWTAQKLDDLVSKPRPA